MGFPRAERVLAGFSWVFALAVSSGTLAAQPAGAASIYCCDVGGQPVCGDILPAACYGRAYREMSPSGIVRRSVPAPLTADEIAQRAAAEHKRRAEEAERMRQLRLDQALLETYRDMSVSLLDIYLSSVSNRLNEIMRVLTMIATVFIPLTFIVGVYGMNFDANNTSPWAMPELYWYYGYPLVWLLMIAIAVGMLVFFRRRRWL